MSTAVNIPNNYIISDNGTITAFVNGKPLSVAKDHPNYQKIVKCLSDKKYDELETLMNTGASVQQYVQGSGKAEVKAGQVFYDGKPIHNTLTRRIVQFMSENLPFEPMLRFLENLMQNPSKHSINELYTFLAHRNLPITEDGCFLAYKRVKQDYKDVYTGAVDNSVGQSLEMQRNEVDDDWRLECSSGFHVGAIEYVSNYYNTADSKIMIVKVNPKDAVSVPEENAFTKCRTCKYTVVGEMQGELVKPLYSTTNNSFSPVDNQDDEDDYPDYDEDDEDEGLSDEG
jgi:hypothetical protein